MRNCTKWTARVTATAYLVASLWGPSQAMAGTNTAAIVTNTFKALPSCVSYQVEGVCFFLFCTMFGCTIRTSIRVAHYVPDAVVSTYNEPLLHPWSEIGGLVATTLNQAGSAMLGVPFSDSSAGSQDEHSPITLFKGGDVVGNPAGMFAQWLSGSSMSTMTSSFGIPSVSELSKFPSQELPNIVQQWANVPKDYAGGIAESFRSLASAPGQLLSSISSIGSTLSGVQQQLGNLSQIGEMFSGKSLGGIDFSQLTQFGQMAQSMASGTSGSFICPGGASMFTLHFQSELDAYFWRGVIPLEMLYPSSWLPGMNEVGSGAAQTWGSRYPRTGELVQAQPVKASAVLAERMASIVGKSAQPHIYTKIEAANKGGFVYFETGQRIKWQALYPYASSGCVTFGSNDSLSLTSWGDGQTSLEDGYAWNLWRRYSCCQRRGAFLFSVP